MHSRVATHAEAVYVARALNLHIETVWKIIQGMTFASYADLEQVVHASFRHLPVESSRHGRL